MKCHLSFFCHRRCQSSSNHHSRYSCLFLSLSLCRSWLAQQDLVRDCANMLQQSAGSRSENVCMQAASTRACANLQIVHSNASLCVCTYTYVCINVGKSNVSQSVRHFCLCLHCVLPAFSSAQLLTTSTPPPPSHLLRNAFSHAHSCNMSSRVIDDQYPQNLSQRYSQMERKEGRRMEKIVKGGHMVKQRLFFSLFRPIRQKNSC